MSNMMQQLLDASNDKRRIKTLEDELDEVRRKLSLYRDFAFKLVEQDNLRQKDHNQIGASIEAKAAKVVILAAEMKL